VKKKIFGFFFLKKGGKIVQKKPPPPPPPEKLGMKSGYVPERIIDKKSKFGYCMSRF